MMIVRFKDKVPTVHPSAYLFPGAQLIGDVEIHPYASIWPNAILRADLAPIVIGEYTNVQDQVTIHVERDYPSRVGNYVTIGHQAIIHAATVEDCVLVGMGAILLNRCVIGKNCIIGAGTIVTEGKIIEPESLVLGIPGKIVRKLSLEEIEAIKNSAQRYQLLSNEYLLRKEP